MDNINNFKSSLKLLQESKFLQGLESIDLCIEKDPNNSILYSNRALFMVEMRHYRQAIKDLKYSLELNNLNYVSYFNLFSLNIRMNCLPHALQDLYCALSAIYLIAAKQFKSYEYVKKAVQYANNNSQARVLKGFMQLQKGRYKQAYEDLVWACGIQNDNNVLSKVRNLIKKIFDSSHHYNEQQTSSQASSQKKQSKRLECSFIVDENINLQTQIYEKLDQFNQIYEIVTLKEGYRTQRISQKPKLNLYFRAKKSFNEESKDFPNFQQQNIQNAQKSQEFNPQQKENEIK